MHRIIQILKDNLLIATLLFGVMAITTHANEPKPQPITSFCKPTSQACLKREEAFYQEYHRDPITDGELAEVYGSDPFHEPETGSDWVAEGHEWTRYIHYTPETQHQ